MQTMSYTQKLTIALSHRVEEVRMGSIIALGKRKEENTAMSLVDCAFHFPTQITQNIQIIDVLAQFPAGEQKNRALMKLCYHPSRPIAKYAQEKLNSLHKL